MHTNAQNEEENMEWIVLRDLYKTSYILVQIVCGFLSLHTLFASSDVCMYVRKWLCVHRQQNRKEKT